MEDVKNGAISQETLDQIAGGFNADESMEKVASALNISKDTLEKILKYAGVGLLSATAVGTLAYNRGYKKGPGPEALRKQEAEQLQSQANWLESQAGALRSPSAPSGRKK